MNNILVVEDDSRVADFLVRGLRAEGYRVELARTGPEGLAMARGAQADALLILDLMLPGLSGRSCARPCAPKAATCPC